MKTFYIKKEDCEDIGWAYQIQGRTYNGNLIVEKLGKPLIVKGDQIIEGYQIIKGYQRIKGDQIIKGGKALVGQCKWALFYAKETLKIGCETKSYDEWEAWFSGSETFETPRDSLAFNQIYKAFLIAKAAASVDQGLA